MCKGCAKLPTHRAFWLVSSSTCPPSSLCGFWRRDPVDECLSSKKERIWLAFQIDRRSPERPSLLLACAHAAAAAAPVVLLLCTTAAAVELSALMHTKA